jgi:hypothetical protein
MAADPGLVPRLAESVALVDQMTASGLTLRLLGGVAVALRCTSVLTDRPYREIGDIDAVVHRSETRALSRELIAGGYEAEQRFNALHGDRRLIFHGPQGKLDVFVDSFTMCHTLELGHRLQLDSPTLPVSDLLLTKLQVVELTAKDVQDAALLLEAHELGAAMADVIDMPYIAGVLGDDWGFWRTAVGSLREVGDVVPTVRQKVERLIRCVESCPKTRRFRLRARIGERRRWYVLPDEL